MIAAAWNEATAAAEFLAYAWEKQLHAGLLAERIVQLDGVPDLDLGGLKGTGSADLGAFTSVADLIKADLVAEYLVIDTYSEALRRLEECDPDTSQMLEDLHAAREELCLRLLRSLRGLESSRVRTPRRATAHLDTAQEQAAL